MAKSKAERARPLLLVRGGGGRAEVVVRRRFSEEQDQFLAGSLARRWPGRGAGLAEGHGRGSHNATGSLPGGHPAFGRWHPFWSSGVRRVERRHQTVEGLRVALKTWLITYKEQWLVESHRFCSPALIHPRSGVGPGGGVKVLKGDRRRTAEDRSPKDDAHNWLRSDNHRSRRSSAGEPSTAIPVSKKIVGRGRSTKPLKWKYADSRHRITPDLVVTVH